MSRAARELACAILLFACGCVEDQPYVCERNADCRRGDQAGVCESNGFCSFEDATCGEGVRRYGSLASPDFANTCVPCVAELVAGATHTCARTQRGALYCWGNNNEGQIGNGGTGRALTPAAVTTDSAGGVLPPARSVSAGSDHACAAVGAGELLCWGDNDDGELGNADVTSPQRVPRAVVDQGGVIVTGRTVSAGLSHTCTVDTNGEMSCWGDNSSAQLAISTTALAWTPIPRVVLDAVDRAVLGQGAFHSCALRSDQSLWCWGGNNDGQVGNGTLSNVSQPVPILLSGVVHTASIGSHTSCAVTREGVVRCWGANEHGQVGDGTIERRTEPVDVVGIRDARAVSVGGAHACAIRADHSLWCWGRGTEGQLGPTTGGSAEPVQVAEEVLAVTAGESHTCALHIDGVVRCFGANASGQLGIGNDVATAEPSPVSLSCR